MKAFVPKNFALAAIVLAGVLGLPHPALAYSPAGAQMAGPGGTNINVFGMVFPCTTTLTVNVASGGAAVVGGVSFGAPGSTACPNIVANNLPWTFGPATLVGPGVYQAVVSGVGVAISLPGTPSPITCAGSVTVRLDQNVTPHRLTFVGILTTGLPTPGQSCAFTTWPSAYLPTGLTAP